MPKIQLFIAATIDGFIARENDSLDWLLEFPNPNKIDHGYNEFISEVDLIIMGRKTYEVLLTLEKNWPYSNCKTYIATSDLNYSLKFENTFLLNEINKAVIDSLKSESKKNIWLVGGGDLITQFLNLDSVDEMIISIIPLILGKGIRLFPDFPKETKFEFIRSETFETGIINLVYKKKLN